MTAALCSASLTTRGATAVRPAAFHLGFGLSRTAVIPSPARGGVNSARNLSEGSLLPHGCAHVAPAFRPASTASLTPGTGFLLRRDCRPGERSCPLRRL